MAAKETSASRNEVPKSPQSDRERSIIEKVKVSYLIHLAGFAKATVSPMRPFNTHKYTRYRRKWTRGCGRSDNAPVVTNLVILN